MAEKLLVNVTFEETRVALVKGGVLSNLEIDTTRVVHAKGNVYKGIVHRVNPSLQAAFVDYGADKQGFLPVSEIHRRYHKDGGGGDKRAPIQDVLLEGQELMVQVVKDEIGNKGASLSTYVSLPGRYLVLMPDTGKTGISRRLGDDERKRLKRMIADLNVPTDFGVIIRTAGTECEQLELTKDLQYLKRLWDNLENRFKERKDSGLIHRERSIALRFIRDYATGTLDEIVVDNRNEWEEIQGFCRVLMPEMTGRVRHYTDATPLFSRYQLEDQIDNVFARRIDLPSGGSVVVDQAEALVAIDVNSGRVKTDDIEETALTTNLEASIEIARQLKLRDLGGLVVVDFIDMRSKENIRRVEQASRDAFASDKAKVKFSRISEFGLMEISRQRLKSSIMKGSFNSCPNCGGTGRLRSIESSALYLLRRIKEVILRGTNYMHLSAKMPVDVANYLLNRKRRDLTDLERESQTSIDIQGSKDCPPTRAYVEILASTSHGRSARRVLLTFDLVRSDVEKREMDHLEDLVVEAAQSRGINLTEDEYADLYRRIEEQVANDAELVAAQQASEMNAAVRDAVDDDRKQRKSSGTSGGSGFGGWLKRLFGGTPSIEDIEDEAPVSPARPGGRSARKPSVRQVSSESRTFSEDDRDGGGGRSRRRRRGGKSRRDGDSSGRPDVRSEEQRSARSSASEGDGTAREDGDGQRRRKRRRRRRKSSDDSAPQGAERSAEASGGSPEASGVGSEASSEGSKTSSEGPRASSASREASRAAPEGSSASHEASSEPGDGVQARSSASSAGSDSSEGTGTKKSPRAKKSAETKKSAERKARPSEDGTRETSSSKERTEDKPSSGAPKTAQRKGDASSPGAAATEKPNIELPKAGGVIDLRSTGVRPPAPRGEDPPAPVVSAKE